MGAICRLHGYIDKPSQPARNRGKSSALSATSAFQPLGWTELAPSPALRPVARLSFSVFVVQAADAIWTEEELMRLPPDDCKCELVDDEVHLSRAGLEHGLMVASLTACMRAHAAKHRLGFVCGSNLGCWMRSGNLRCPDVSFIGAARVPRTPEARQGFFRGARFGGRGSHALGSPAPGE